MTRSTLGCASHQFTVSDRNGNTVLASGNLTSVEYNRVLNDASTASVTVGVTDQACCGAVGRIRSWHHVLNIYRDGEFMWSGFVTSATWSWDAVTIQATDLIGLLDRRVPHQDFVFNGTDLTAIAEALVEDALFPDDPGHTTTVMGTSGVLGGRAYAQDVGQTADHLRDLADTGIDFTALGTNIIILPDRFCEVVGRLTDSDLPDGLSVTEDGASLITRQIVAGSDESGVLGVSGGVNEYYGLLELYTEQTSITTTGAAQEAAAAKLAASAVVPVAVDTQNVTIAPSARLDVAAMVPGWCVDIVTDATCRTVSQRLKITGLQVQEDGGSGETPGKESIMLQVAATGETLAVF